MESSFGVRVHARRRTGAHERRGRRGDSRGPLWRHPQLSLEPLELGPDLRPTLFVDEAEKSEVQAVESPRFEMGIVDPAERPLDRRELGTVVDLPGHLLGLQRALQEAARTQLQLISPRARRSSVPDGQPSDDARDPLEGVTDGRH